jgi:hypothetical protein
LVDIAKRDQLLVVSEADVFSAVCRWLSANPVAEDGGNRKAELVRSCVRFNKMPAMDFCEVVRPSGLFTPEQLMTFIHEALKAEHYRGPSGR